MRQWDGALQVDFPGHGEDTVSLPTLAIECRGLGSPPPRPANNLHHRDFLLVPPEGCSPAG